MGTDIHVLIVAESSATASDLVETTKRHLCRLESLWSRFVPSSEISRLNANGGRAMAVTDATFELVQRAIFGWQMTNGRFDPTLLGPLIDLGYDRSFELLDEASHNDGHRLIPSDGCSSIETDPSRRTLRLAPNTRFDPGGIGKGLAADMASASAMTAGARGVLVNVGGDLRVRGTPPDGNHWVIKVRETTLGDQPLATVHLIDGGVATSTTLKRRWSSTDGERHHLVDPKTCLPHDGGVVFASVVAGDTWWAEVAATAMIGAPGLGFAGCAALQIQGDGTEVRRGNFQRFEQ